MTKRASRVSGLAAALAALACTGVACADEPAGDPPIVVRYSAPAACPSPDAFAASVKSELAGRRVSRAHAIAVTVEITRVDGGYSARATSAHDPGQLERTVDAPTCPEVADIAAAIVALAQTGADPEVIVVAQPPNGPPPPSGPPGTAVPDAPLPPAGETLPFTVALSLGYAAFTAGPANPVIQGYGQVTTFNPAIGARLGIEVARSFGWWNPSLHLSVAYYRQGTGTVTTPNSPIASDASSAITTTAQASINDRDVLHSTIEACPMRFDYAFLSAMPCATFSMIQNEGQSGGSGNLETGIGLAGYVRARYSRFFVEGFLAGVKHVSSDEPPTIDPRFFYALSAGLTLR